MPAIALNGIEFNLARAIGPALGGFLIVAAGIGTVFWLNAVSYLGAMGYCAVETTARPARLNARDRVGCDPRGGSVYEKRA